MSILSGLDLHPCLRARIHRVHSSPPSPSGEISAAATSTTTTTNNNDDDHAKASTAATPPNDGFVLYLPTVCLRYEQNPAFALACRAANRLHVPLVVLAVVADDASHARPSYPHRHPPTMDDDGNSSSDNSSSLSPSVVMTSRRLTFVLQALSHACDLWSKHGAAVGVRIHGAKGGARTPDHLTLASRASLVITDEPFVSPFSTLAHRVEGACRKAGVECVRVDGSCTVPPVQVLKRRSNGADDGGGVRYDGVPTKAYVWQKKTERMRDGHLRAAMEGHFDAPALDFKMEDEDLFVMDDAMQREVGETRAMEKSVESSPRRLSHLFPSRWKAKRAMDDTEYSLPSAPDVRPFTSRELSHLYENGDTPEAVFPTSESTQQPRNSTTHDNSLPFHDFALSWVGADPTVPPCPQTVGTSQHGMARWNDFVRRGGLRRYGKERNDARSVHAVSRMSAYLNLGIVSAFRIVWEVKRAQQEQQTGKTPNAKRSKWDKTGADKFEEEIVKWREMSYAHAFSRMDYDDITSLPRWSVDCLENHPAVSRHTLERLANGTTGDVKWDAMQQYLVRTGELHNNVRMTWGKTVVEWMGCSTRSTASDYAHCPSLTSSILRTLCYLNDRYALDGLSPPSYAGLLWCMGWTDKPSGGSGWTISKKPAYLYRRMTAEDFRSAEQRLLASRSTRNGCESIDVVIESNIKQQTSVLDMMKVQSSTNGAVEKIAGDEKDNNARSKSNADDFKQKSAHDELKRSASSTIDNFFSKRPTTAAKGKFKKIIG